MAKGNMVLTLVAQTKAWATGLKKAARDTQVFGGIVGKTMKFVSAAFLGAVGALVLFLPNFIKMGEEARKSELRLKNIADNTGLFEKNLNKVTKRISDYAEQLSYITGIDDELIRENEAVLLTFKNLASSADEVGGPFDRAVQALLDLEAAGKNLKAVQLGKALQDPINNMTALRKAGIMLTDAQKKQIKTFQDANNILGAQEIILSAIEDQVGGTAEATASATDRMSARFENVVETLSEAFLPAVDEIATALSDWFDSEAGKKAVEDLKDSLMDFSAWVTSPDGKQAFSDFGYVMSSTAQAIKFTVDRMRDLFKLIKDISDWFNTTAGKAFLNNISGIGGQGGMIIPNDTSGRNDWLNINPNGTGNTSAPGGPRPAGITVNFNTPVDSVSAGREIARVLSDYDRARGRG